VTGSYCHVVTIYLRLCVICDGSWVGFTGYWTLKHVTRLKMTATVVAAAARYRTTRWLRLLRMVSVQLLLAAVVRMQLLLGNA